MNNLKFLKEAGKGPQFKLPVAIQRWGETTSKAFHDIGYMCRDDFAEYLGCQIDRYLDGCLEFRECPRPEGFVDKSQRTVANHDREEAAG